jgi:lipid-A-disaccharide synthase
VSPEAKILTVMPGSRRTEASRLLPVLGAALRRLAGQLPQLVPVVPAAGPVAAAVQDSSLSWPVRPIVVTGVQDKHDAFAASDAALTKSGTSTLELALAGVPMIVTYRVNPVTAMIVRRLVKVRHVSLLNLLAGRELVPELLQEDCTPDRLAAALSPLLSQPAAAEVQRTGFRPVLEMLRSELGPPSEAAALAVLRHMPGHDGQRGCDVSAIGLL